jgi:hypothetical protein
VEEPLSSISCCGFYFSSMLLFPGASPTSSITPPTSYSCKKVVRLHLPPSAIIGAFCLIETGGTKLIKIPKTRWSQSPTFGKIEGIQQRRDILVVNIGTGSGTPAEVNVGFEFSFKNVAILKRPHEVDSQYVFYYILNIRKKVFDEITQDGMQPHLSLKMLNNIPVPLLPPLAEQKRIVAKLEALQSALAQAGQSREKVLASVIAGVVG